MEIEARITELEAGLSALAETNRQLVESLNVAIDALKDRGELISTRALVIVDEQQKPLISLQANDQGGGIVVKNRAGATVAMIGSDDHGGMIAVANGRGEPRASMEIDGDSGRFVNQSAERVLSFGS